MKPSGKTSPARFKPKIDNLPRFTSLLEVPSGENPEQNAWLTLTLRYRLDFVDRASPHGIVHHVKGKPHVADFDKWLYPILDWDGPSTELFRRIFQRGESIWNFQFLLKTPKNYDGIDYSSFGGSGWTVRPNVLCLFRLEPAVVSPHLRLRVVRLDPLVHEVTKLWKPQEKKAATPTLFRSHSGLYTSLDVYTPILGHELGHALGMSHIKNLAGDKPCLADEKKGKFPERCYGETQEERENIMGSGTRVYLLNAKPWQDRILKHTSVHGYKPPPQDAWAPTGVLKTPPRKVPMNVSVVGPPEF